MSGEESSEGARVRILEHTLILAHLPTAAIPSCFKQLLRLCLCPHREMKSQDAFFSVISAHGDEGLSMVLDTQLLSMFPCQQMIIGPEMRAIKVYEGADAISE